MDPKDPKHLFEGNALIRCLVRIGVLDESRMRLDYVPDSMETEDFLELQLQTQVFKSDLVQSIHHAHVQSVDKSFARHLTHFCKLSTSLLSSTLNSWLF